MARAGHLNFSDIPEMLPGARPGANPAQREEFERTSRRLHEEEALERSQEQAASMALAGVGATGNALEDMFPMLDAALVRMLRAEAPSEQHAMETLLALAAATAEPDGSEGVTVPDLPPKPVGIEDHDKFPLLVDNDGWQVAPSHLQEAEEEKGSGWRDRAKAAADKPAPKPSSRPPVVWGPKKKKQGQQMETDGDEHAQPLTDYDCRHRAGQKRVQQRVQYGRGRGSGAGRGGLGGGRGAGEPDADEEEEDEEEIDLSTV